MMTPEESSSFAQEILDHLSGLMDDTVEDIQNNCGQAQADVQLRWQLILMMVSQSETELQARDHQRLVAELETVLMKLEQLLELETVLMKLEQLLEEQEEPIPPVHYIDANPKPVESLWTEDELKQFTTKGY